MPRGQNSEHAEDSGRAVMRNEAVCMNRKFLTTVFIALLFIGASFVLSTTASLPDRVASHFGAEGLVGTI